MQVLQGAAHASPPPPGVRDFTNPSPFGHGAAHTPSIPPHTTAPQPPAGDSPLELEHALGFNGRYPKSAAMHPTSTPPELVYATGQLVVTTNTDDVHRQTLLRGHDAWVSCVAVSPSGRYIASGQEASRSAKGLYGFIVIWDFETKQPVHRMQGHVGGTLDVEFSPDERWLGSTGLDGKTLLWEVSTGKVAGGIRDAGDNEIATTLIWGTIDEPGTRRQAYHLYATYNTGVRSIEWRFDIKTMQHRMSQDVFHVPGSGGKLGGFVRKYTSAALAGGYLVCGTASSDVVIFSTETLQYKTSFQVGGGGVNSVAALPGSFAVLAGSGDGKVTRIQGNPSNDKEWTAVRELQLQGSVTHMHLSQDGSEAAVTTTAGVMYRLLTGDLTASIFMESHTGSVVDAAFPHDRCDVFATAASPPCTSPEAHPKQSTSALVSGGPVRNASASLTTPERSLVKVWSLSDYSVVSEVESVAGGGSPTRIAFAHTPNLLVSGWSTGALHAYDVFRKPAALLWSVPAAHKGPVMSLAVTPQCIISAGDGVVRVWSLASRECVAVMQNHTRPVTSVLPDVTSASIFHTCSMDKTIMTFDLTQKDSNQNSKAPRRLTYKSDPESAGFTSIAQRRTGEREIIAGGADGVIQFFDIDYAKAVFSLRDTSRVQVNSVDVNPTSTAFVTAQQDGSVTVYEMDPHRPHAKTLAHTTCHSGSASKAVWSRDGRQVISIGSDGEICLWNFFM